jgi:hypothetical protein
MRPPFAFVRKNTWMPHTPGSLLDVGWGNGYVSLPIGHPWHGMDYQAIPVLIHGCLTYGEFFGDRYVIGFDTGHLYDTLDTMPREKVERETKMLLKLSFRALTCRRVLNRWQGLIYF